MELVSLGCLSRVVYMLVYIRNETSTEVFLRSTAFFPGLGPILTLFHKAGRCSCGFDYWIKVIYQVSPQASHYPPCSLTLTNSRELTKMPPLICTPNIWLDFVCLEVLRRRHRLRSHKSLKGIKQSLLRHMQGFGSSLSLINRIWCFH